MNGFQIVSITIAALFCLIVLIGLSRRRISLRSGAFWLVVWLGAAAAIFNPEWTRLVAERLGIARGADFVFYCAILGMFIGFFLVYTKLRRLDQAMTTIVREAAILRASTNEAAAASVPTSSNALHD